MSKDLSILKYSVPEYIMNTDDISKYINCTKEASIEDGGSELFIYLKKNNLQKCLFGWHHIQKGNTC